MRRFKHLGFSLLEVILALGILCGAMAVLGELARLAMRNAAMARDLSRAQLLCESKLSEITAGITEPTPVQGTACETQFEANGPQWLYSIDVASLENDGLLSVQVTVSQDLPPEQRPVSVSLSRWIPDPNVVDTSQSSSEETSTTEGSNTSSTTTGSSM